MYHTTVIKHFLRDSYIQIMIKRIHYSNSIQAVLELLITDKYNELIM